MTLILCFPKQKKSEELEYKEEKFTELSQACKNLGELFVLLFVKCSSSICYVLYKIKKAICYFVYKNLGQIFVILFVKSRSVICNDFVKCRSIICYVLHKI